VKVVSVVGARPQFVKLAPIASAFARTDAEHVIVHTGQHYDPTLSDVFFSGLSIPSPDVHLAVGSGSHGHQTAAMLSALEDTFADVRPDWVLVYGDTNSTIAAALAAVKIHIPLAHLEAGLRSFNRLMPEEHNRVLTDHAADLLLAPTDTAMRHLGNEGLAARSVLVGDVMADICLQLRRDIMAGNTSAKSTDVGEPYLVATIHRAENTDDPARLAAIIASIAEVDMAVHLFAHPRLRDRAARHGIDLTSGSISLREPLPYRDMVAQILGSSGVITDSGGVQKESFLLERPCTTLRTETEWTETLEGGWNVLLPGLENLSAVATRTMSEPPGTSPFGDGHAADAAVTALATHTPSR